MRLQIHLLLTVLAVVAVGNMPAHAADNDALMKNAMSAAPEGVAKNATIMITDAKGGMITLKKGTNGFTCMPDDPTTPTNDPMCADENSMLWIQAYLNHAQPLAALPMSTRMDLRPILRSKRSAATVG